MRGPEGTSLNPHLVACLLISALSGVAAAGLVMTAGWGGAFALLTYSFVGSGSLVAVTLVALPVAEPAPVVAERRDRRSLA
jgi:hypothetical protein